MALTWSPQLMVGLDEIDRQHQELFRHVDDLVEACNQGTGVEYVSRMIAFLDEYAAKHFDVEERYMAEFGYPKINYHRAEHQVFRKNLAALKDRLAAEGPGPKLLNATHAMVVTWLNNHVRNVDKELAAFLKTRLPSQ
jgi:hemerythrin